MSNNTHFDYIIIGNGLAGLQLALALSDDAFFDDKQIALIDRSDKSTNDKTWCFWEQKTGKWDHIVHKNWHHATFHSSSKTLKIHLDPYVYKMIRSIDFYETAKSQLLKKPNFHFIIDTVTDVIENDSITVTSKNNAYTAGHVFDSSFNDIYFSEENNFINVYQHFKGWVIETENEAFDLDTFTMMDYRLKDGGQTTFTYVLPLSKKKALIEFTYFTPQMVNDETYDKYLKQYISDILKIETYNVVEIEKGHIPMTNFPFEKYSTERITKIGTAGGWVKGSTGYSFKHTEKKVAQIIENLKNQNTPSKGLFKKRHRFYDTVFLKVLHDKNHKGEKVFEKFYSKNDIKTMFKFLDEESTLSEELSIMSSLFSTTFIKAFFKTL